MEYKDVLLQSFLIEVETTRRFLERVPADKADWKPHPKSMSLIELARHLAEITSWFESVLLDPEFDIPADYTGNQSNTAEELVAFVDQNKAASENAIRKFDPATLNDIWTLKHGGNVILAMPRIDCVEGFCIKHLIHHRAQLGVYFRMLDINVPASYGPSADERPACN